MKILKSKFFIGTFCFLLGVGAVLVGQNLFQKPRSNLEFVAKLDPANKFDTLLDQFYDDDFFGKAHDPFEQMKKMRSRMMKDFDSMENGGGIFDSWYQKRFGGGNIGEMTRREDKDFIYYDIAIKDLNKEKLNVTVENGQISVSGQIEKKSQEKGMESVFTSSFHRSFPAPQEVDAKKVQTESTQDKLILKFPKTHS